MTRKIQKNPGRAGLTDEIDEWVRGFDFDGVEGFDFDLDLDFDLVLPDLDLVLPDLDLSAWSVEGEDVEWDTWDTGEGDGGQMGTNGDTVEGDGVVEGMVTDGD